MLEYIFFKKKFPPKSGKRGKTKQNHQNSMNKKHLPTDENVDKDNTQFNAQDRDDGLNSVSSEQIFIGGDSITPFSFAPDQSSSLFADVDREGANYGAAPPRPEASIPASWATINPNLNFTANWPHEKNTLPNQQNSLGEETEHSNKLKWTMNDHNLWGRPSSFRIPIKPYGNEYTEQVIQSADELWNSGFFRGQFFVNKRPFQTFWGAKKVTKERISFLSSVQKTIENTVLRKYLNPNANLTVGHNFPGYDYIPGRTKRVIIIKGGFPVGSKRRARVFLSHTPIGVGSFYSLYVKALSDFCRDPRYFKLEAQKTYQLFFVNADQFITKKLENGILQKRNASSTVCNDIYLNDLETIIKGQYFVCDLNKGHDCGCYRRIHGIDLNTFEKMKLFPRYINGREYYIVGFGFYASNPTTSFGNNKYDKFCLVVSIDGHFVLFDRSLISKVVFFLNPRHSDTLFKAMKEAEIQSEISDEFVKELNNREHNFDSFVNIFSPSDPPKLPLGFQRVNLKTVQDVADDAVSLCKYRTVGKATIVKESRGSSKIDTSVSRSGIFFFTGGNPTPLVPSGWLHSVGYINFCPCDLTPENPECYMESPTEASNKETDSVETSTESAQGPPQEQSSEERFTTETES